MNILWVISGGLWPANTGGRQRSLNIISQLAKRHQLTVLTTHDSGDDVEGLRRTLSHCHDIVSFPFGSPKAGSLKFAGALWKSWLTSYPVDIWKNRVPALRKEVSRLLATGHIDLCVVDFLSTTASVPKIAQVPMVLFQHNVEHIIWKRLIKVDPKPWRKMILSLEWRKMRRYEAQACQRFHLTLSVSDIDKDILLAQAPGSNVRSIATGVDTDYFVPGGEREISTELVFTGSMDWYPNEDAILHFVETTLPLIRREIPGVTLTVVGRNPTNRVKIAASHAGVKVTGTVPDVRPYIDRSAVYIVPLRVGGGTRMKIFEAMAMGKAVVSTTIGAEGLPLISGKHFLKADSPKDFAEAVVFVLRNHEKRKSLGLAGREHVLQHFSWSEVTRDFEAKCQEIIKLRSSVGLTSGELRPIDG